ncbi:PTS system mannose/fructose/N-acetylgalactosamine-transporter subunit IIB [Liquorilactobacillus oeni]|uniref:PTS system mannose/fructose/N-acetylgalactosamine-transporter subunit IIB n=1 Tax=Liquorilactobacillus oeni TaxID=303241 RepID=UPI00070B2EB7|nr:PTS sugar transporter subunit IIB [Liquorilactobacillus oeni]
MNVRLLRIDSRLLHGQVATNWAKITKVERILVASDGVARDRIRKTLIVQAAPPGIKVNIVTIAKMIRIYHDLRFSTFNVMILVENPIDAKKLIAGGIEVRSVNIGAISFDNSRKMITDTIAVNQEDAAAFKWMHERQIKLDVRKVSGDSSKDLWKYLDSKEF